MNISPIHGLEHFFVPKKQLVTTVAKIQSMMNNLRSKWGEKRHIQLVFRGGPASKPTQVLDR